MKSAVNRKITARILRIFLYCAIIPSGTIAFVSLSGTGSESLPGSANSSYLLCLDKVLVVLPHTLCAQKYPCAKPDWRFRRRLTGCSCWVKSIMCCRHIPMTEICWMPESGCSTSPLNCKRIPRTIAHGFDLQQLLTSSLLQLLRQHDSLIFTFLQQKRL